MKGLKVLTIISAVVALTAADGGRISIPDELQTQCLGRQDGVFLPVRGSCTQYLVCMQGTAILRTCGNYHFDARRSVCDLPANAGCISFGPFPLPIAEVVCFGKNDGSRIAVAGSKNKFFFCMHGKAALHNCGTLLFDERKQKCVAEIEDPEPLAESQPESQPEPQPESQPEPIPHPTPEETPCQEAINGARLPVQGNIRQYYVCINNRAFLKNCGNMYFNAEASACALMPEQQDAPSIKVPPTQTDNQAVLPPQQLPGKDDLMIQKICQGKRLGARVALPGSCTDYYICMGQTGIPKSCGNLQFNPINMACGEPSSVRCKAHANGVVYYGATDSVEQPVLTESTSDQICYGRRDGIFLAAPGKCSEFYFCFQNKSYQKTCGPTRHFSPITLSCVELEESNCVEPQLPAAPAVQDPMIPANSCLTRANGVLLRHPSVCGKFLICDNSRAVEMNCPDGLHFNTELNVCDWPTSANCIYN